MRSREADAAHRAVQALFDRMLERIDIPENRFELTSWGDRRTARREVEALRQRFIRGERNVTGVLKVIWAPTSDMQEISLTGGWGQQYLRDAREAEQLLNRYDHIVSAVEV